MKLIRASGTLGLVALAVIASPSAMAGDSGWYIGGNAGQASAKIDDNRIRSGLLSAGLNMDSISDDDRDFGFKVFGGYRVFKYLAIEGGYFDLGDFGFKATTTPPGTLSGNIKLKGFYIDDVGILPITEKFSAFGRAGLNFAEARDSFNGTGSVNAPPNRSKRDWNYKFGVGLQYDFTKALGLRAEVERYRINDAFRNKGDIDVASIGLVYRFFGNTPAPAARVEAPEPAAAPAPQPVAETRPPPAPEPAASPRRVTFSADSLFDFNKATVKPAGKRALDTFVAELGGADFDVITVTGHTDRIGSHAYNQKLSERRAQAVKTYLVQSAEIPASKIEARGVDGSEPVTKPGQCKGTKRTKKLIACLQPDRRVEVEVTGTR